MLKTPIRIAAQNNPVAHFHINQNRDYTIVTLLHYYHAIATPAAQRHAPFARLAQSVERQALNLMVVGSSPTVGAPFFHLCNTLWRSANAESTWSRKKIRHRVRVVKEMD